MPRHVCGVHMCSYVLHAYGDLVPSWAKLIEAKMGGKWTQRTCWLNSGAQADRTFMCLLNKFYNLGVASL